MWSVVRDRKDQNATKRQLRTTSLDVLSHTLQLDPCPPFASEHMLKEDVASLCLMPLLPRRGWRGCRPESCQRIGRLWERVEVEAFVVIFGASGFGIKAEALEGTIRSQTFALQAGLRC